MLAGPEEAGDQRAPELIRVVNFVRVREATGGALGRIAEMAQHPSRTALVVEDEPLVRQLAADLLEEHGFQVIGADRADDALRALESRSDVSLLFTDIQLPGALNGIELAWIVRERWPQVDLIITSGRAVATKMPATACFIAKPYKPSDLMRLIDLLCR